MPKLVNISSKHAETSQFANEVARLADPEEEFSKLWWFKYFWSEAGSLTGDRTDGVVHNAKTNRINGAKRIFQASEDDVDPNKWSLVVKGSLSDDDWREGMILVMKAGFRCVPREVEPKAGAIQLPVVKGCLTAAEHKLLQRQTGKAVKHDEIDNSSIHVYWRSETRAPQTIINQKGTLRQVDVEGIAKSMHMDKDTKWHPFSDPEISKFMWYRLANADNDYYTVISVATDWHTCCAFPKIDEKRVYDFPKKPLSEWTKAEATKHRANLAVVDEGPGKAVCVMTETTTYMLVHTGSVLDTQGAAAMQNRSAFPELGVDHIPLSAIYALIPIRRAHHGPRPEDGFTVFVQTQQCQRIHAGTKEHDLFGVFLAQKLFYIYIDCMKAPPFATSWSHAGAAPPEIKKNYSRIAEFPITELAFQNFLKTLKS